MTAYPSCLQCYGYGFAKIEDKSNMFFGAYVHPDFQRDDPTRACTIQRRSTSGSDRRFKKKANPTVKDHNSISCGTHVNTFLNDSLSSLESWLSSGEKKPEVRLDSMIAGNTSDSLFPSQISTLDDWLADLQVAFASSFPMENSASPSKGMISFAEFKSLFEPRPIELMIKK